MKVVIKADSQDELDLKRPELIEKLAGKKFDVTVKPVGSKRVPFTAQGEMLEYWNRRFRSMLDETLEEIEQVLKRAE